MVAVLSVLVVCLMVGDAAAKTLSKEEVDAMWEDLLRQEQYRAIAYLNRRYSTPTSDSPTNDKAIVVIEGREGYWWGLGGLSEGGGWVIKGQLEAEVPIKEAILQLYSKGTSKWSPGFLFIWMPGYDPNQYPQWEFRLILRGAPNRQQIHTLKSIFLQPGDVLPTFDEKGSSIKELLGQRIPRGELRYDAARQVAVIKILGVHHPTSVEVPLTQPLIPVQEKGR
jgi:hypothetical protein